MKFRKKPVVIEAILCLDALCLAATAWSDLPTWLSNAYERGDIIFADKYISITTLEGTMRADLGDWVIQGVKGEIYPCKPDIFEATYEKSES